MSSFKALIEETIGDLENMDQEGLQRLMEGTTTWVSDLQKKMESGDGEEARSAAIEMQQFLEGQMAALSEESGVDYESLSQGLDLEAEEIEELQQFEKKLKDGL